MAMRCVCVWIERAKRLKKKKTTTLCNHIRTSRWYLPSANGIYPEEYDETAISHGSPWPRSRYKLYVGTTERHIWHTHAAPTTDRNKTPLRPEGVLQEFHPRALRWRDLLRWTSFSVRLFDLRLSSSAICEIIFMNDGCRDFRRHIIS